MFKLDARTDTAFHKVEYAIIVLYQLNEGVIMSSSAASPYINFQGHAREAMEFYQKALGGKLELFTENEQGPPKEAGPDDHIMHSMLQNDGLIIMGSDGMPEVRTALTLCR